MTKHTPTPWKHDKRGGQVRSQDDAPIATASYPNAAFIVRAVNAHEELLNEVRSYLNDCENIFKLQETASRLKKVIAKAEGK